MLFLEQEVHDEHSKHSNGFREIAPALVERSLVLPDVRYSNLIVEFRPRFFRRFYQVQLVTSNSMS